MSLKGKILTCFVLICAIGIMWTRNLYYDTWTFVYIADIQVGSPRSFRFQPAWNENWDITDPNEYLAWYFGINEPHRSRVMKIFKKTDANASPNQSIWQIFIIFFNQINACYKFVQADGISDREFYASKYQNN